MKRFTVPAFLVAAVLAFSLAGCSGAQPMTEDTLKGVWKLDTGSSLGFDAYIHFGDDSVAEVIMADSWLDGTWSVSGTQGTLTFASYDEEGSETSSDAKMTYSNNKLTLGTNDGSKLIFVKDDSEEAKSMFEYSNETIPGLTGAEGSEAETQTVEEQITPLESAVTIADDDNFTITVTGKGTDFTGDAGYQMSITNKTDKAVYVIPEDDFTVGDKTIEAGLGDELEAGETIETFMYFAQDELGGTLDLLTNVNGVVQVLDDETDDVLASYTFHMD